MVTELKASEAALKEIMTPRKSLSQVERAGAHWWFASRVLKPVRQVISSQ